LTVTFYKYGHWDPLQK